jgi:60Kd inner membrane protein
LAAVGRIRGTPTAQEIWDPKWWNLADQAINAVQLCHDFTHLGYVGIDRGHLPFVRSGSVGHLADGLAHLQRRSLPSSRRGTNRWETPTPSEQRAFAGQMQALFQQYEVQPFAALAAPLIQTPIFLGMFFGMRKMPELFPDDMGGWHAAVRRPDRSRSDLHPPPRLRVVLHRYDRIGEGADDVQHGPAMVNFFRAMAVVMVPVMTTFPAAMLCYWVPNNVITMAQSLLMRTDWAKAQFGIWDRPKPVPRTAAAASADAGFQETMTNLVKQVRGEPTTEKERMRLHNQEIETKKRIQQVGKATSAQQRRR